MAREFRTVGVVGLGTMGAGIVEVFARSGLQVSPSRSTRRPGSGVARTSRRPPAARSSRGKMTQEQADELLAGSPSRRRCPTWRRPSWSSRPSRRAWSQGRGVRGRGRRGRPEVTILCSNTSSLSVTELAVHTKRPGKVVGMHFFNPAPVQKLVEVVRTVVTEHGRDRRREGVRRQSLGKVPVVIGDRAGFIANALLFGYLNHAAKMYDERYASREDLDAGHALRLRLPDGPARAARPDRAGHRLRDPRDDVRASRATCCTRRHPVLKQMITAGLLGRKSGRGFYTYEAPHSSTVVADARDPVVDGARGRHAARRQPGRRRRHRHDGQRHRRGARQGRATTSSSAAAATPRSTGRSPRSGSRWRRPSSAAS